MKRLLELDARLTARLHVLEKPGLLRRLAIILGHSGDSWFWLAGLFLIYWQASSYWQQKALAMIVGIILTAVVVLTVKFSVRRARPAGDWGQLYRKTDPHSFPSGHAARAVMLAVMALSLGPVWLGALLAVWALLVGIARVATGLHYVSDVFAGWILGIVMGYISLQVLTIIL